MFFYRLLHDLKSIFCSSESSLAFSVWKKKKNSCERNYWDQNICQMNDRDQYHLDFKSDLHLWLSLPCSLWPFPKNPTCDSSAGLVESLIKEHKHSSQTLNTTHTHTHTQCSQMNGLAQHNGAKLNHWCQNGQKPSPSTPRSLTHRQELTNKHVFVCPCNVFWIRRYRLWLEGAYGHFSSLCKSVLPLLFSSLPGMITELIIWFSALFISFCALSFNSHLHFLDASFTSAASRQRTAYVETGSHNHHWRLQAAVMVDIKMPFFGLRGERESWHQVLSAGAQNSHYFHRGAPVPAADGDLSRTSVLANSPGRWQSQCHSKPRQPQLRLSRVTRSSVTLQPYTAVLRLWTPLT